MGLDGCGLVCKYILVVFNIIFAVVGLAFLILGLWLRFSDSTRGIFEFTAFNSSAFVIGVTVLIVLGALMLIVVAFGDYGACSENRCALQVFSVLLSFMAIAEIAAGVLAYTNSDKVGRQLGEFYTSIYGVYAASGDPGIAVTLVFIHKVIRCCGLSGIPLIEIVQETCPKPNGFVEHFTMPSCPLTILTIFDSRAGLVLGIFVGVGALLIVALICSATLSSLIRQSTSSPQYITLTHTIPALATPQPSLHDFASTYYPDQDPVVFTPLSVANIPVPQAANIAVPQA